MSKTPTPNLADAEAIAAQCDDGAAQLNDSLPAMAERFRTAALLIRAQRHLLMSTECPHTFAFVVTAHMVSQGLDDREPGRYCMTCGEKRVEKKTAAKETT